MEWTKETANAIAESERVQKGVAWTKEKAHAVAESERVQKSVEWTKEKAQALAESERVKRGLEMAEGATVVVKEQTAVAMDHAQKGAVQARTMWKSGVGEITRAKEVLKTGAWRGSAKETLDISKREEWARVKVKGSEEVTIAARSEYTTSYMVKAGHKVQWTFRVQALDVGFVLRRRIMKEVGGSMEEDLLAAEKYDDSETCTGSWVAEADTNVILAFDNSYSILRPKTVAFLVGIATPDEPAEATPPGPHI